MKINNRQPQTKRSFCEDKLVESNRKLSTSKAFPDRNLNNKDQNTVLLTSRLEKNEIKICYTARNSSQISISLFDHFGKRVSAFNKATVEGENRFLFNLKQFCAGIYSIRILDLDGKVLNETIELHKV